MSKKQKRVVEVDDINPVDFFNRGYTEHTVEMLLSKFGALERNGVNHLTLVKNQSDRKKHMIRIHKKDGTFEAMMQNGLNLPIGQIFSPFMMIQKFIFKNSFTSALTYVKYTIMNNENDYFRIGTKYILKGLRVDRYGIERDSLEKWERQSIIDDHGVKFLGSIDKYKGWCLDPNNKSWKQEINGYFNNYHRFEHTVMPREEYKGDEQWQWTKNLLKHIFGEDHYHLGLVYLKVLYEHPRQALPILALLSQERQTGKTTFVYYMSILFGANTTVINPQDISNQFNGGYGTKNIIMIEESHFESRQSMEKIKNLATQKIISINTKFTPQYDIPFFGKIIITSNDENKFTRVDTEEIRFWVRKIPTLVGKANHNILLDLRDEIPAFLFALDNLHEIEGEHHKYLNEDGTVKLQEFSRMVLDPEDIATEALTKVKEESRESLHKEIEMYLDNHSMQNTGVKEFYFIGIDIKERFFSHNHRYGVDYINKVLKTSMNMEKIPKQMKYAPLEDEALLGSTKKNGRPYVFPNPYYGDEDLEDNDDIEVPF